ncbi:hypothetical protein Ddye_008663 [Dipteronia dyeriana]|uniref:Phosphate transporter PHO1 homolog 9-like n=1 Tax=Dipteronia dyeriana TaxID=168575 RepID=A0AAD9XAF6_9ROSI|nr:hypothetical protein Ddye_008663 [Dipteronia dyeriana]
MKFGKEFAAQLVQEWREAYMDYNFLKTILRDVLRSKQKDAPISPLAATTKGALKRRVSLYRAFSGLTSRGGRHKDSPRSNEDEAILVDSVEADGQCQTMFFMSSDQGGEHELVFFRRLDDEFNKVVSFYKNKVEEVMSEADELSKQMDALIALRIKVEDPELLGALACNDVSSSSSSVHPINARKPGHLQEESTRGNENGGNGTLKSFRPASLDVLDHVKIKIEPETPVSTLRGVLSGSISDITFSKSKLKKAEELMTQAFVVFYQKLRLLKSYCFLNQLAVSKILKKYDKITSRNASKAYLKMVDNSYLGSSDELMERVEATFVKHFANGNHRKGMNTLRPKAKRERHTITFFLGTFFGCSIALLVAVIVSIHARDVLNSPGRHQYMENIFPLYSFFGYIFLHLLMYAGNIYFWKRYRINYSFIFGFKQGTELGYREVLLVCSALAVLTFGGILSNLDMEMDPRTRNFEAITEIVPLALLVVVILVIFCPFNIIYRSSRFFLIRCVIHCIFAPLYKVTLPDFFLADQLTSQVQALRSLEFYVCYYGWGDFKRRSNRCRGSDLFDIFYLVVAIVPYWFRFLQCVRRLFEEKNGMHFLNGLKYFSTIVAVSTRTIYELRTGQTWLIVAIASSVVATIANTYWDIVIDWGLLRRSSRNHWLRDKLIIPNKSVYFIAMVLNIILRLAWMQTVLGFREAPFLHRTALIAVFACLEIIRRGIWNFFRLENEHLNNVGKYRAFKSVPLPFNYEDDEDKSKKMKFGKEFAAQLVQEWREAYMDYNFLKTILRDVLRSKQKDAPISPLAATTKGALKRRVSFYRAFSGLTSRGGRHKDSPRSNEDEAILVDSVEADGQYQTMFFMSSDQGGEHELVFFRRLDDEFNKVVSFYKNKVEEVMSEADELSKQMDALIALRIKVEDPELLGALACNDVSSSSSSVHPINARKPGHLQEESTRGNENGGNGTLKSFRPASLDVLDHVKIKIEPETPVSTLRGVLSGSISDITFSKSKLKKAEELMTQAFVVFYQKLRLLKSYCFLNQLAVSKILKKYDKITSRNASKAYLKMVDNSYLGSSDEVNKLMERVEATFVKHFANGNHRKGMNTLRPKAKRERHTITFFLGTFFGCSIALLVAVIVSIHARDVLNSPGRHQYMENIFPLYSFFGYIFLHLLMYAGNIYFWKRYRINYSFIFGFKQGTELGYREVLLVCSALAVLTFGGILSNLDMEMDPRTRNFEAITEIVPLALLVVVILVIFCPFNIIYRSSRFFLIRCVIHCIFAPLYKVTLPDFFLADQLTSQVQALRSLEFYVCYYGWGDFKRRSNRCRGSDLFDIFYLVVAIVPYWFRFLQCVRRLFEEKNGMHFLNGLKYFSTIVAVSTRTIYELRTGQTWLIVAIASSVVATIANTYWDIVIDWGLLRRSSRNHWLRDKLIIPNKSVYFIAMVLNIILRLAWMQTVLGFREAPFLHRTALIAVFACLEIIRRGIWNFFRLENEHLNNVGKYRAFKSVPLPFNYEDDEDKSV